MRGRLRCKVRLHHWTHGWDGTHPSGARKRFYNCVYCGAPLERNIIYPEQR